MLKSRIVFFFILIVLTVVYVGGCRRAGKWLVKEDMPEHADAMVILMGDFPDRVLQAADLYHEGRAGKLIIVEVSMGPFSTLEAKGADIISNTEQARNAVIALGIPADSITVLPGNARSTQTEALIVRDYLADNTCIDTLILVSSPAHMRRASMIFKAAFRDAKTPVYIGCSPSIYTDFDAEHWWRGKEGIQTVLAEFVKIGSFVVFEKRDLRVSVERGTESIESQGNKRTFDQTN
jgi:uncharacterized SAM-binding protein YcdF (DUF218 family)